MRAPIHRKITVAEKIARLEARIKRIQNDEHTVRGEHKRNRQRNADICAYYERTQDAKETAQVFKLGRARVYQILQKNGLRPLKTKVKSDRVKFLGVNITDETKNALKETADRHGISMSEYAASALERAVASDRG